MAMFERRKSFLDVIQTYPIRTVVITFIFVYSIAVLYVRSISDTDPGSIFFSEEKGYQLHYTNERIEQAEELLTLASTTPSLRHGPTNPADAQICIGIASVERENARYLRTTVASLLEGLRPQERGSVYMNVFIAHSDPSVHQAYSEDWLPSLADNILIYDVNVTELEHIKDMETRHNGGAEKRLYDYMYMMKACYLGGAPYIALFEDDIIAMDGWLHRTQSALQIASQLSEQKRGKPNDFYFLRLFYTEQYLGWQSEDAVYHASYSIAFVIYAALSIIWLRTQSAFLQRHTTTRYLLIASLVVVPMFILLFFAGGRNTMSPVPAGVSELKKVCCSQAFLFPREKAGDLVAWYEKKPRRSGDVDVVIAHYGRRNGELKLALTPPVVQHIGRISSKGNEPHKMFNFGFEKFDAKELRREHAAAVD